MALGNSVQFVGRLTSDPESRAVGESTVCNFSIAINEYAGKDKPEIVNFFNLVAWSHSANYLTKYAHKGDLIICDAHARNESYEKDGVKHTVTKFIVDEVRAVTTKSTDATAKPTTPKAKPAPNTSKAALSQEDNDDTGPLLDIDSSDLPF